MRLIVRIERERVYCAVRFKSLFTIQISLILEAVNIVQTPATVTEHFCYPGLGTEFLQSGHNHIHQILSSSQFTSMFPCR
jgi:hypothetical protein